MFWCLTIYALDFSDMFEATKSRIMAETQECVSRVYSAVRTRLSSLAHRVSSLETELRCKAQVVQVLESRIAELERRFLPQPDHAGDFQHAGQVEPGAPAQVHHLPAIEGGQVVAPELEEHVAAGSEDHGEAAQIVVNNSNTNLGQQTVVDNSNTNLSQTVVDNSIANVAQAVVDNSIANLGQTVVNNSIANLGQAVVDNSVANLDQTVVDNSIANLGQTVANNSNANLGQAVVDNSVANLDQTVVDNSVANLGQTGADNSVASLRAGYEHSQTSSKPLSMGDLAVLQQRLSKRLAELAESPSASTPVSVIRKASAMKRRVEAEVRDTEARILDLSQK